MEKRKAENPNKIQPSAPRLVSAFHDAALQLTSPCFREGKFMENSPGTSVEHLWKSSMFWGFHGGATRLPCLFQVVVAKWNHLSIFVNPIVAICSMYRFIRLGGHRTRSFCPRCCFLVLWMP